MLLTLGVMLPANCLTEYNVDSVPKNESPNQYADYVKQSIDQATIAADEIERDLHRALPEVYTGDKKYVI